MVCQSGVPALFGIPLFCARFELREARIMQRPYCLRSALRKVHIVRGRIAQSPHCFVREDNPAIRVLFLPRVVGTSLSLRNLQ